MLLVGTVDVKMDAKKRFRIPSLFRASFSNSIIISIGMEDSFEIWNSEQYKKAHQWVIEHPSNTLKWRNYKRLILANTYELTINEVGRVLLPKLIAEKLNDNNLVLIGNGDHLELWSKIAWNKYNKELLENKELISSEITNNEK